MIICLLVSYSLSVCQKPGRDSLLCQPNDECSGSEDFLVPVETEHSNKEKELGYCEGYGGAGTLVSNKVITGTKGPIGKIS